MERTAPLMAAMLVGLTACRGGETRPEVGAGSSTATASSSTGSPLGGRQRVTPPSKPMSFRDAKKALRELYEGWGEATTLYAGCPFRGFRVDWSRCCYRPSSPRGERIEWEHVVPAAAFGKRLDAWSKGHARCVTRGKRFKGRRCARKASPRFRRMEGDLHNLWPAIGALNQARGMTTMGLIDGEARAFGGCDLEIDRDTVEPRPAVRGDIARTYLYMDAAYPDARLLDADARARMTAWHQADPPDAWERRRDQAIAALQGNHNPWVR